MEQVEQLCDDICLISKGEILVDGPLREIKRGFGRDTVVLAFDGDDGFLDALEAQDRVRILNRTHHRAEARLLDGTTSRQVLEAALSTVDDLHRFELSEPPLTEIFITLVTEQQGQDAVADVARAGMQIAT